jgi:hypothetical protein
MHSPASLIHRDESHQSKDKLLIDSIFRDRNIEGASPSSGHRLLIIHYISNIFLDSFARPIAFNARNKPPQNHDANIGTKVRKE